LLGYSIIAKRLSSDPNTKREGNTYWKWVETYVADDYSDAVRVGCGENNHTPVYLHELNMNKDLVEKNAVLQSPHRIEELVRIFVEATKLEKGFWDMGTGPRAL
jgi:hydroxymethylpyrimidine/phosphomethylpyrimidine kinase